MPSLIHHVETFSFASEIGKPCTITFCEQQMPIHDLMRDVNEYAELTLYRDGKPTNRAATFDTLADAMLAFIGVSDHNLDNATNAIAFYLSNPDNMRDLRASDEILLIACLREAERDSEHNYYSLIAFAVNVPEQLTQQH